MEEADENIRERPNFVGIDKLLDSSGSCTHLLFDKEGMGCRAVQRNITNMVNLCGVTYLMVKFLVALPCIFLFTATPFAENESVLSAKLGKRGWR